MDRWTALVVTAQRRLRLRRLLMDIERNPGLLENDMALRIRKPIELVGLKSQLLRADAQEKEIAAIGARYGAVQAGIDELIDAHKVHVGELEHYESDLRRKIEGMVGNGGDPLDGQGQGSGQGSGQIISSETKGE